jgi:hypothetical protein
LCIAANWPTDDRMLSKVVQRKSAAPLCDKEQVPARLLRRIQNDSGDCVDVGNVAIRTRIKGAVYEMGSYRAAWTAGSFLARAKLRRVRKIDFCGRNWSRPSDQSWRIDGIPGRASMLWAAGIGRAAYDPETISMLTTVLERALAALPRQDRTEERKTRLASSILGAAARGERDPLLLYATALGGGPWEPAIGEGPASQPIRSIYGQAPRVA